MPVTKNRKITDESNILNNQRRFIKSFTAKDTFDQEVDSFSKGKIFQAGILPNQYTKSTDLAKVPELYYTDPYPREYKARLGNSYAFDYAIRGAVSTLIHYVLGRELKSTVYPITRDSLKDQQQVDDALSAAGLNQQEVKDLQAFIDTVDEVTELKTKLRGAMAQSYVYGRSALWIKRATAEVENTEELAKVGYTEGVPTQLLLLNAFYLGQVTVDPDTSEPTHITYESGHIFGKDQHGKPLKQYEMPITELVYFPREDYHMTPANLNYGLSPLQAILPVSEVNRRLNERVFPEINTSQWAGSGIIQFQGLNQGDMESFTNEMMKAGNWKATNQQFTLHEYKLDVPGDFLLNQRDRNVRQELMQLRVPSFLMNFEDVTNRATTELVASVWQETVLEAERDWLRDILWKYWYRPLMELYFPDKEFLYIRAKVMLEFQSIDFSSLIEKAVAISNLVASNIISVREGREMLKLPPFPEDQQDQIDQATKVLKNNPDMIQNAQNQNQQQQQQQQVDSQGNPIQNPQQQQRNPGIVKLSKSMAEGNITTKLLAKAKKAKVIR